MTAMQNHMAAIKSGNVTKTNVIGLRKALGHVERLRRGLSGNRLNATADEVRAALNELELRKPIVRGDLHASGVRVLADRRYRKRLAPVADKIAALQGFSFVGFHDVDRLQFAPVYLAWGDAGTFYFYTIPWQLASALGLEGGPHILESE